MSINDFKKNAYWAGLGCLVVTSSSSAEWINTKIHHEAIPHFPTEAEIAGHSSPRYQPSHYSNRQAKQHFPPNPLQMNQFFVRNHQSQRSNSQVYTPNIQSKKRLARQIRQQHYFPQIKRRTPLALLEPIDYRPFDQVNRLRQRSRYNRYKLSKAAYYNRLQGYHSAPSQRRYNGHPMMGSAMPFGNGMMPFNNPMMGSGMPFGNGMMPFNNPMMASAMPFGNGMMPFNNPMMASAMPFGNGMIPFNNSMMGSTMPLGNRMRQRPFNYSMLRPLAVPFGRGRVNSYPLVNTRSLSQYGNRVDYGLHNQNRIKYRRSSYSMNRPLGIQMPTNKVFFGQSFLPYRQGNIPNYSGYNRF